MTNEITAVREAVEVLTGYGTALSDPVQTLIDLAKRYLEAEGMMPSKKSVRDFQKCATGVSGCECNMKPVHFNEAIDLCTLAVVKQGLVKPMSRTDIMFLLRELVWKRVIDRKNIKEWGDFAYEASGLLSGKVGKQDIEKRLEGIEKYYEEMKEIVEDKEATPEMRSNARSFIRGMDYIRKHMRL